MLCHLGRGKGFAQGWIQARAVKAKGRFPPGLVAGSGKLSRFCCGAGAWVTAPCWQSPILPKSALGAVCCWAAPGQGETCSARTGLGAGLRLPHPNGIAMASPSGNRSRAPKKLGERQPLHSGLVLAQDPRKGLLRTGCAKPELPPGGRGSLRAVVAPPGMCFSPGMGPRWSWRGEGGRDALGAAVGAG